MPNNKILTEDEIQWLDFPQNVRTRYGMYIKTVATPDNILREVVDNSVDEMFESEGSTVNVGATQIVVDACNQWGYSVVADNGRGIPFNTDEQTGLTKTALAMSKLHAGSKFKKSKPLSGMNGVGAACTNALSKEFTVYSKCTREKAEKSLPMVLEEYNSKLLLATSERKDLYYFVKFIQGIKDSEGVSILPARLEKYEGLSTITEFSPDPEIYKQVLKPTVNTNSIKFLNFIMKEFYNKEVSVTVDGHLNTETIPLKKHTLKFKYTSKNPEIKNPWVKLFVSFEYSSDFKDSVIGTVNSLPTMTGVHVNMTRDFIGAFLKKKFNIKHNLLTNGLQFFVVCLCPEPNFAGQLKEHLEEIPDLVDKEKDAFHAMFDFELNKIVEANKEEFQAIVDRLNALYESMQKVSEMGFLKGLIDTSGGGAGGKNRSLLPKKLIDATSSDRSQCELIIVEGESAGGTVVKARTREIHGILKLRGKPLQTVKLEWKDLLDNAEMRDIIASIGMGLDAHYVLENQRYCKIIICADADPDGAYIAASLIGTFGSHMKFLIDNEMVFIADVPLYLQNGRYFYSDDMDELDRTKGFSRFKGLAA